MRQVIRYHPLLVTLHWLLGALIVGALLLGFFVLDEMANTDPWKIVVLQLHMAGGMLIFALMLVRFIARMSTARPAKATTGYPLLDRIAPITHYGFYVLVLLMVTSGYATGILAGLNRIVFQRSGEPLPASFDVYPTFVAHSFIAALLAGLIILHALAALYHQFVRRDGLFARMWFGRLPAPAG